MNYLGIDYHKKFSHVTALDEQGQQIFSGRVSNSQEAFSGLFDYLGGPNRAVLESSRTWSVMYDLLTDFCEEVKLAHPLQVKAIAWARIKTDEIDSRVLADLLRADLVPEAHVPSHEARFSRQVLRQRMFFVKIRTMVKNRIHVLVDRHPELGKDPFLKSDLFGKAGARPRP